MRGWHAAFARAWALAPRWHDLGCARTRPRVSARVGVVRGRRAVATAGTPPPRSSPPEHTHPAMEDAHVMQASEWAAYDPAAAAVPVDGTAEGAVLPHLRFGAARAGAPADCEALSADGTVRVQVLSARLLRVERRARRSTTPFEDRPTFCFAFRGAAPGARFQAQRRGPGGIRVRTDWIDLVVDPDEGDAAIYAVLRRAAPPSDGADGAAPLPRVVRKIFRGTRAGVPEDDGDLLGTCRTLDEADGYSRREWASGRRRRNVYLGNGLLSREAGLTFLDDTARPVFTDDGWFASRNPAEDYVDCYVLACGTDYTGALTAFTEAAGPIPMIPRRYLGNWWSRYYAYTQDELSDLVRKFQQYRVPLSMCIIDMDWHMVKPEHGIASTSDGWTGYTWCKELFPDPAVFIQWLHDRDTGTALNLHPAGGVHSHEEKYEDFGKFIGAVARKTGDPIPFDLTDPMSASAYFKCLIHPLEEESGELGKWSWWLDWQQGSSSRLSGVDPLFLLNHLHYLDMARDSKAKRRPVVFSRYAGHGSHRMPIGFSGDTYATWESLAFQPYMTQTAANCAFPYWSHDIGGHTRGVYDDALYVRWVQFGCFSPILRLHSSNNPFIARMPWAFNRDACHAACSAMRLRHALVPYMYACNYRTFTHCEPLVKPMYYIHPTDDNAYAAPAQYWFGSQMVVAPFASPPNADTRLSRQAVWLPPMPCEGEAPLPPWRHLFTGEAFSAGWHTVYGDLDSIPVFAPAGAIVPMASAPPQDASPAEFNTVDNPRSLVVYVVAGGQGEFHMYEDEETGEGRAFVTCLSTWYESGVMQFDISPPRRVGCKDPALGRKSDINAAPLATAEDFKDVIPASRAWTIRVVGIQGDVEADVSAGGTRQNDPPEWTESIVGVHDEDTETTTFVIPKRPSTDFISLSISCSDIDEEILSSRDRTTQKCEDMIASFNLGNEKKWELLKLLPQTLSDTTCLASIKTQEEVTDPTGTMFTVTPSMKLALLETIDKCGFVRSYLSRPSAPAVVWNGMRSSVRIDVVRPGAQPDDSLTLPAHQSEFSSQIVYAPGTRECEFSADSKGETHVAEKIHVHLGNVVIAEIEMRDPDDEAGEPVVKLSSAAP